MYIWYMYVSVRYCIIYMQFVYFVTVIQYCCYMATESSSAIQIGLGMLPICIIWEPFSAPTLSICKPKCHLTKSACIAHVGYAPVFTTALWESLTYWHLFTSLDNWTTVCNYKKLSKICIMCCTLCFIMNHNYIWQIVNDSGLSSWLETKSKKKCSQNA